MVKKLHLLLVLFLVMGLAVPAAKPAAAAPASTVTFTILHTNDLAKVINDTRASIGADNVALLDMGDFMQGSLISNLFKGKPTVDLFNFLGYKARQP